MNTIVSSQQILPNSYTVANHRTAKQLTRMNLIVFYRCFIPTIQTFMNHLLHNNTLDWLLKFLHSHFIEMFYFDLFSPQLSGYLRHGYFKATGMFNAVWWTLKPCVRLLFVEIDRLLYRPEPDLLSILSLIVSIFCNIPTFYLRFSIILLLVLCFSRNPSNITLPWVGDNNEEQVDFSRCVRFKH